MRFFFLFFSLFLSVSCQTKRMANGPPQLTRMHIVDRNGLSETISAPKRLERFKKVDFDQPQPYQKVLRIFSSDRQGNIPSTLTSYYPNGQLQQALEVVNSRAYGAYKEWHANGQMKLQAQVIGGIADLSDSAALSWIFDGESQAFDERGHLLAKIFYQKGELEGQALHFHQNGQIWKQIPYEKGCVHGKMKVYYDTGNLLQEAHYSQGVQEGTAHRYWPDGSLSAEENWLSGRLEEASYYDRQRRLVGQIIQGTGFKASFNETRLVQLTQYRFGLADGQVSQFSDDGTLIHTYHQQRGLKEGEEVYYSKIWNAPQKKWETAPKISISWQNGNIQGLIKTWYENGQLESQKEMADNSRQGVLSAWYPDGSLMLIEEYDKDLLVRGEYLRLGDGKVISKVIKGTGTATLFDPLGNFIRKINYKEGLPTDS